MLRTPRSLVKAAAALALLASTTFIAGRRSPTVPPTWRLTAAASSAW